MRFAYGERVRPMRRLRNCNLEATEAVCVGDGIDKPGVLELLQHLVDRSLVVAEESDGAMRYRLLETIRTYALERLAVKMVE